MPKINRKNIIKIPNDRTPFKSSRAIRTVEGLTFIDRNHRELKHKCVRALHPLETSRPTDSTRKKVTQLVVAYNKIYDREQEDINLVAAGLSRFKK